MKGVRNWILIPINDLQFFFVFKNPPAFEFFKIKFNSIIYKDINKNQSVEILKKYIIDKNVANEKPLKSSIKFMCLALSWCLEICYKKKIYFKTECVIQMKTAKCGKCDLLNERGSLSPNFKTISGTWRAQKIKNLRGRNKLI